MGLLCEFAFLGKAGLCQTFGVKDQRGDFVPKITIVVGSKDILIKKTDPQEKFRSISLTLNPKNSNLLRHVGLLNIEWLDANNKAGRPMPFAGPRYEAPLKKFQDSMIRSAALRIVDKSNRNLFVGKTIGDLFQIQIDDQPIVSSESVVEGERTVQLGAGRDVSVNVGKSVIVFNESNFKKGEILNVDNRSGMDQSLGIELPEKGLLFYQVRRNPEQTKIPKDNWDRFTVAPDSGIFIALIPDRDPAALSQLDGKEIVIKVFQGGRTRETKRIPIKIAADLKQGAREPGLSPQTPVGEPTPRMTRNHAEPPQRPESAQLPAQPGSRPVTTPAQKAPASTSSLWVLIVLGLNLALIAGLGLYSILFILPRIQVLEDRLAKSEMFIHGTREAIRDELDQVKDEILLELHRPPDSE